MGGSAGKISYPEYISIIHSQFLDHDGVDLPTRSITDVYNTAVVNNPFLGEQAFNPDIELARAQADVAAFKTLAAALDPTANVSASMLAMTGTVDTVMDDTYLTTPVPTVTVDDTGLAEDVAAYAAIQNTLMDNTILPPWKAGMHNINAVTSSAFVIGEAIIRAMNQNDIARYATTVRSGITIKNNELNAGFITQRQDLISKFQIQRNTMILGSTELVMKTLLAKNTIFDSVSARSTGLAQVHIAAKYDEKTFQLEIDENDVKWEIGLFQPVGAFIGAMSAGGGAAGPRRPSRAASIAGGALTGAASGAMMASGSGYEWVGALVGAAVGAGAAALSTA